MQEESSEGGTKIPRRQPAQQMQQAPPQQHSQQQMQQPQINPQQMQQQQMQHSQQQQYPQQQQYSQQPRKIFSKENLMSFDDKSFKYSLLVVLIFIILNSKIIWKQISRFPFMGAFEPSIVALIVNSVLAGLIFYMVSNFILKN